MFYIVVGVVLVFLGWMQAPYMQMMRNKKEARSHWARIHSALKARAGAILRVMEIAAGCGVLEPEMEQLYDLDGGCIASEDRDVTALSAEESVPIFDRLAEKLNAVENVRADAEYQPLLDEIWELEETVEGLAERFNCNIEAYNQVIAAPKYAVRMKLLKPEAARDFQLDRFIPQTN